MNKLCLNLDLYNLTWEQFIEIFNYSHKYVDVYKINLAFIKDSELIKKISHYLCCSKNKLVILDAKYGDIENTNKYYANYCDFLSINGVTLNPFGGLKTLKPFIESSILPYIWLQSTETELNILQKTYRDSILKFAKQEDTGIICPSHMIPNIRKEYPNLPILCPGIGHQGGKIKNEYSHITYCVGRSVLKAKDPERQLRLLRVRINKSNTLNKLRHHGCILKHDVVLSSGRQSNIYYDLRKAFGCPPTRKALMYQLQKEFKEFKDIGNIISVHSGGTSWGSALAFTLDKNFAYLRSDVKDHGTKSLIEGSYDKNAGKTLLIDDVVTTGNSINKAKSILNRIGINCDYTYVILDRSKGVYRGSYLLFVD